jgi:hypothetical protein
MSDERATESGDRPNKQRGKWVTIRTFPNAEQAHLTKLQLDRAGIPCYIDNENVGTTLWYAQPAVDGIRLRVPVPFEQQAKDALEIHGQTDDDQSEDGREDWQAQHDDPDESDEDQDDEEDEPDEPVEDGYGETTGRSCPACHTADIARFTWLRRLGQAGMVLCLGVALDIVHPLLLALALMAAVYLLLTKPDCRCLRCGKRWVIGRDIREA